MRPPKSVEISLDLKIVKFSGTWEPNDAERKAAWELYVELLTRITTVPLLDDEGLLSEALASYYSLFAATREILRRYGPALAEPKPDGEYNLGFLAIGMLNQIIRPVLAYWHPVLQDWEHQRALEVSRLEHEDRWNRRDELRQTLARTSETLAGFAHVMADACGVSELTPATGASE